MRDETWRKAHTPPEKCGMCGEMVGVGDWPFCKSESNPEGHRKGTYRWGLQGAMRKWHRVGK